jgi:hypothetical protein
MSNGPVSRPKSNGRPAHSSMQIFFLGKQRSMCISKKLFFNFLLKKSNTGQGFEPLKFILQPTFNIQNNIEACINLFIPLNNLKINLKTKYYFENQKLAHVR